MVINDVINAVTNVVNPIGQFFMSGWVIFQNNDACTYCNILLSRDLESRITFCFLKKLIKGLRKRNIQ